MKTIANQISIAINSNLERKNRIKAENALKELNQDLEQQVLNRSKALIESQILLRLQYEQERILGNITAKIRDSLELNQILQTTTQELLNLIKCDRVLVYGIQSDGKGKVVAESVQPDIPSLNGMTFSSEVFPISCYNQYLNGKILVVKSYQDTDIECLKDFMNSLGVKAVITIGIVFEQKLWGLLIFHQCKTDRDWQSIEVSLVQKISVPLSVAIKQANLYQQMEDELNKRIELNRSLETKLKQEQLLNLILERLRWSFNLDELFILVTSELRYFLNADRVTIRVIKDGRFTYTYQSPNDSPATQIDCMTILANFRNGGYLADSHRLALPIVTETNTIWGILSVFNHKPTNWDIGTIKLLDQITNQIALGIEKNSIQQKMERELRQKNSLLKEVHHRVKNNLQIMSSLFRLQTRNLDKSLNPAIEDAQSRIYAMALVHEQLYGGENFDSIDMKSYVTKLVTIIFNTYNVRSGHIELVTNIPPITIPLDKTVPLGLIFNELITNAIKYAFPSGEGIIKIDVTKSDKSIEIIVADNGVGLPPHFTPENVNSLGILLVSDLTEQLEGKFTFHNDNGAVFILHIPMD
jgi:two-component sensor histidine kinase